MPVLGTAGSGAMRLLRGGKRPPMVLINEGTYPGWSFRSNSPGEGGTASSYGYAQGDGIRIHAPWWGWGHFKIDNVNMTGVKRIKLVFSCHDMYTYSYASVDWPNSSGSQSGITFVNNGNPSGASRQTITQEITDARSGTGSVFFYVSNSNNGSTTLHYLAFEY